MKKQMNLKKMLAVLCVAALLVGVLPVSGFAMDLEAYYQKALAEYQAAYAEYEAALQQQLKEYEAAVKAYRENDGFDVEAVFEYLMSLRTPEEQKAFYRSLTDNQRRLLVEYMMEKAEKGEFKGFDDPAFALKDEIEEEREAIEKEHGITTPTAAEAEEESEEEPDEAPALTEDEQFALDYAPYIKMYEKYGTAGNYDDIPYEAFLKIQEMYSTPAEEESAEEESNEESAEEEESEAGDTAEEDTVEVDTAEEEPVKEDPAEEEPAKEEPADEKPAEEESSDEEPVTEDPAEEEPVKEESADEKPVEEKTAEEKPTEEEQESSEDKLTTEIQKAAEKLQPSWSIQIPNNRPITYGAEVVAVSVATPVNVENLGDSTIYLTITSNCVFTGKAKQMPVTLCVGGVPVVPGEAVVYGTVTAAGAKYAPVTLVFSEDGWSALSSGRYSMNVTFDSYNG